MYTVTHEMTLSGNTWTCPECGRTVQVSPMKILEAGDTDAQHYGGELVMDVKVVPLDNGGRIE